MSNKKTKKRRRKTSKRKKKRRKSSRGHEKKKKKKKGKTRTGGCYVTTPAASPTPPQHFPSPPTRTPRHRMCVLSFKGSHPLSKPTRSSFRRSDSLTRAHSVSLHRVLRSVFAYAVPVVCLIIIATLSRFPHC